MIKGLFYIILCVLVFMNEMIRISNAIILFYFFILIGCYLVLSCGMLVIHCYYRMWSKFIRWVTVMYYTPGCISYSYRIAAGVSQGSCIFVVNVMRYWLVYVCLGCIGQLWWGTFYEWWHLQLPAELVPSPAHSYKGSPEHMQGLQDINTRTGLYNRRDIALLQEELMYT